MSHTLCHIGCDFESNLKNLESNLKDPKNLNFPKFCHFVPTKRETGLGGDDEEVITVISTIRWKLWYRSTFLSIV